MDLNFTPEEETFRQEIRQFIADNLPEETRRHMSQLRPPTRDMVHQWVQALASRGWSCPRWPVEYGGPGWDAVRQYIFFEEIQAAPSPDIVSFGTNMVGPVIFTFGTEAQKAHYLPKIATLEHWWCQGFSEPGAGSDLAAVRTKAVRDGDGWVIDGQKTWTTYAHRANMIFVLARTDPHAKKQEGISFFLVDMSLPGVSVRPIQTIDGDREINEVFLDNVRVPASCLVGEENKGWDYAKFLLGNERTGIARVGMTRGRLQMIEQLAAERIVDGRPLIEHARFRDRLTELQVELKALEMTVMRVLSAEQAKGKPNPATSVLKLVGADMQQRMTELYLQVAGEDAVAWPDQDGTGPNGIMGPDWADAAPAAYFNMRKVSIYGGSTEVQKNIIAKAILGL
ncbi:acyl-CoA dehydrogenase family protein [Paracoccus sp. S1E-3]|uniref:acyl-CoA dehydrogenase family protein n=1 Tax=Paracoccus sp. S1E-3 TaxID=2756130 RepID=UPI0015EEB3E1|nr:acyl-CoA dehydrogenase family protein [Paracoccus sp. S1E-3]MBA4489605.1 acyl-CoA dehydrogenase family protein [Paracoccus sp. S1E-3]